MTSRSGIQLVREKSYWQLDKRKSSRLNGLAQRAQCWIWTFISYFALHCCVGGDFAFTWNKVWLLNERVYSEPEGHILYYTTALEKRNLYSVYMYISFFFFCPPGLSVSSSLCLVCCWWPRRQHTSVWMHDYHLSGQPGRILKPIRDDILLEDMWNLRHKLEPHWHCKAKLDNWTKPQEMSRV